MMKYYMIFYRPKGSSTFTPCGKFHGVYGNLYGKAFSAWERVQELREEFPKDEFSVYGCKPEMVDGIES